MDLSKDGKCVTECLFVGLIWKAQGDCREILTQMAISLFLMPYEFLTSVLGMSSAGELGTVVYGGTGAGLRRFISVVRPGEPRILVGTGASLGSCLKIWERAAPRRSTSAGHPARKLPNLLPFSEANLRRRLASRC